MDTILARMWPDHLDTIMLVFAVWRYSIALLVLILLVMQPEGSTFYTLLLGISVICIMVDSIWAFSASSKSTSMSAWNSHNENIGTLLIRIPPFVVPIFVAAGSKNKKSRFPGIITTLLAIFYFLATWLLYQRDA